MNTQPPPASLPDSQPPRRRIVTLLLVVVVVVVIGALVGGGYWGYQTYTTGQTQTAVALGATATVHQQATGTQVAEVTGTAEHKATFGAQVAATSTARHGLTATSAFEATAISDKLLASVGSAAPTDWKLWRYYDFADYGNWHTGPISSYLGTANIDIQDGEYVWDVSSKKGVLWWEFPTSNQVTDFYMSVDARRIEGGPDTQYALVFRQGKDDDAFYVFLIQENGFYSFERAAPKGPIYSLLRDGYTTAIVRNQTNTIAARGIGSRFTLYVNNTEIATVEDTTYAEGTLALGLITPYGGLKAKVAYDNFFVLVPR